MRTIFREGELVSAEVQALHQEGGVALQTRTMKFGRLLAGQLVTVAPSLVKRQKQHFVALQEIGARLGRGGAVQRGA
jgi:exosome complex component RRP4